MKDFETVANVLSMSSQVARGAIGNTAIRFALERLGHTVFALPTILLSNHPGHMVSAGRVVGPTALKEMLDALEKNGWLQEVDAILTGYMPSLDHVAIAVLAIEKIKALNPKVRVMVDPAFGDDPKGLYVDRRAAEAIGAGLLRRADIITPNRFELEWLAGRPVTDTSSAHSAAQTLDPEQVLATSIPSDDGLLNLVISRGFSVAASVAQRKTVPHGTGDLFAALYLAQELAGARSADALALATAGIEAVLDITGDKDELDLVGSQDRWADPDPWPTSEEDVPDVVLPEWEGTGSDWVAGVDGCKGGWIAVFHDLAGQGDPHARFFERFADVLDSDEAPRIVAVDIPIGLPEQARRGGRTCDVETRKRLGGRQSSVFAVPARPVIAESEFGDACRVALEFSDPPRKVSLQCFNLFPKIREVDALMTPSRQNAVFECHPESAFVSMNEDVPLDEPKKVKSSVHEPGIALRRGLLEKQGFPAALWKNADVPASMVGPDDLVDACACAWTAARIAEEKAQRFPEDPPVDGKGLRMEIWS